MPNIGDMFEPPQDINNNPEIIQRQMFVYIDASQEILPFEENTPTANIYYICTFMCGCTQIVKRFFSIKELQVLTWTHEYACSKKRCTTTCKFCHKILCTKGRPNGYQLYYKGKPEWYCPDCYEIRRKEILRLNFWEGLKEGFFGKG